MNNLQFNRRRTLAKKLSRDQPLSTADYRFIQSLIERVLGVDELREVGRQRGEGSCAQDFGNLKRRQPSWRRWQKLPWLMALGLLAWRLSWLLRKEVQ